MEEIKLVKEVKEFQDKCIEEIVKFTKDGFDIGLYLEYCHYNIISPIEQILLCALRTIINLNYIEEATRILIDGKLILEGLAIWPQYQIEKYRVDFFMEYNLCAHKSPTVKSLIIECDSQEFHERSEEERRYEKARDRFLSAQGYKIFHYTGAEIIKNPLKIAKEILTFLTEREDIQEDYNC